jgi:hypothetical protein
VWHRKGESRCDESGPHRRAANGYGYDGGYDHRRVGESRRINRRAEEAHVRAKEKSETGIVSRLA